MSASRWENLLWPTWLPETARMPVVAQVTGAVALTALIMGPWWSRVDAVPPPAPAPVLPSQPAVVVAPAASPTPLASSPAAAVADRPAHLNLDVRHSFANVAMVVTVDGKRMLDTRLEGSGKKFKMFGKRPERNFTRTLELQPGVRLVRVNIKSNEDRFDQTRVERFELGSASVASLRITADKTAGLIAVADRPVTPKQAPVPATPPQAAPQPVAAAAIPLPAVAPATTATQQADALADLLNSLRSMLIAIAGFVASAATGFVVQEYLRSKKGTIFNAEGEGEAEADEPAPRTKSRRRRRSQVHPAVEP